MSIKYGSICLKCNDSTEYLWKWYSKGKGYYCCKKCNATMPNKKKEDDGLFTWEDYEKD